MFSFHGIIYLAGTIDSVLCEGVSSFHGIMWASLSIWDHRQCPDLKMCPISEVHTSCSWNHRLCPDFCLTFTKYYVQVIFVTLDIIESMATHDYDLYLQWLMCSHSFEVCVYLCDLSVSVSVLCVVCGVWCVVCDVNQLAGKVLRTVTFAPVLFCELV